jgi:general stress protein YciG
MDERFNEETEAEVTSDARIPAPTAQPKRRGFAAMDPARVREISRAGGKAAHAAGTAHEFTSEEARVAGRKGGRASRGSRPEISVPEVGAGTSSEEQRETPSR